MQTCSSPECVDLGTLLDDSNNLSLKLTIMYRVSVQGANLDTCCSRVLVATFAINAFLEIHADYYSLSAVFQRWWWIACIYCRNTTTTTRRVRVRCLSRRTLLPLLRLPTLLCRSHRQSQWSSSKVIRNSHDQYCALKHTG